MKFPCQNCPDRVLGCHDTCEKYQFVKDYRHKAYLDYVEKHNVCAEQTDYVIRQINKQRKRIRRR